MGHPPQQGKTHKRTEPDKWLILCAVGLMVMNVIDFGLNPSAALDAPRWQWLGNMPVGIEQHTPQDLTFALAQRVH